MKPIASVPAILIAFLSQPAVAQPESVDTMRSEAPAADDPDEAGIIWSHPDNPRMVAARERARSELPAFFARLANPAANETYFTVKFDLGEREFIWADELRREGGRLTGRLTNTPINAKFRLYQRVEIADAAIFDWGYFRDRVMQGNYSTRVQLDAMDSAEAREIRALFGW